MTEAEKAFVNNCEERGVIPCPACEYVGAEYDLTICSGCRCGAENGKDLPMLFQLVSESKKYMPAEKHLQDSGARREFSSGAVRDIADGKGRCDLLPLGIYANFMDDVILANIANFIERGAPLYLWDAFLEFQQMAFDDIETAMLELSKHFEDGCQKYGERNWEKGIPVHCYIDSAVRHYFKYLRGDCDERHDRAFLWNLLCCLWTIEHRPEMNDMPDRTFFRSEES